MQAQDWAGFVLTVLTILGIGFAGLRWFIRNEVRDIVREEIKTVKHELSKNGGSSTKDKIDFIYDAIKKDKTSEPKRKVSSRRASGSGNNRGTKGKRN